ncbi:MAG: hypothetical protein PHD57_07915 [Desulfobacterales bacterium]|nr:hypothetical protein [Desulfobacterales bacterium]MDD3080855.1 hypothetical protein [Desulfobacterales bacterium]MDD4463740.1 hypothetical protein [Desulfobacterales bacterium]
MVLTISAISRIDARRRRTATIPGLQIEQEVCAQRPESGIQVIPALPEFKPGR